MTQQIKINAMNLAFLIVLAVMFTSCDKEENEPEPVTTDATFTFQEESEPHEGTWLQWPHHHQYGRTFRDRLDPTWVALTKELVSSENVHIVAYNDIEKMRIIALLNEQSVDLSRVDFLIQPNDDFWIRDNGPIYVHDEAGNLVIQDWGFNGWGNKTDYKKCNAIPTAIGATQSREVIDLDHVMINEGGSVELDGNGALMACKSSILNENRNPGMTQEQAEDIFSQYLGVTHFIWLDGQAGLEITDQHIDGFARFGNSNTIVTMETQDLLDYDVQQSDIDKLFSATNKDGQPYDFLKLPLTQSDVVTTYGENLGYKGSYCNYYIANTKVIVPTYNDPNDDTALEMLRTLYPSREVVGIDFRDVYANGGMVHCVTQQQPLD